MTFWIFEQHAPATAMPPITSALQFPISNHASGTHSSPLLGDRHAPGGLLRLQHLRDNRCKQTTRREMPKHAFAQAPLTCTTALFLRTPAPRDSARTPTFRNSAHTNSEANRMQNFTSASHIELKAIPRSHHFTAKDLTKLNGTYLREEIWEFSITSSYIQFHVAF